MRESCKEFTDGRTELNLVFHEAFWKVAAFRVTDQTRVLTYRRLPPAAYTFNVYYVVYYVFELLLIRLQGLCLPSHVLDF